MLSMLLARLRDSGALLKRTSRRSKVRTPQWIAVELLESRQLLAASLQPRLSVSDAVISEANAATDRAQVIVSLDRAALEPIAFQLTTRSRTALAGIDFPTRTIASVIPAGERSVTFSIAIEDDVLDEANEVFDVVLSASRRVSLAKPMGMITILDDDAPPDVSIGDVAVSEGGVATVPVTLSTPSALPVTVVLQTLDRTAASTSDYVALKTTATILPGTTSIRIPVTTRADLIHERDETLTVIASNARNATLARAEGTITILNNDASPLATVAPVSLAEGNTSAVSDRIVVRLSAASGVPAVLSFSTSDRTATNGTDFVATSGTIVIPAGQLTAAIPVTIIGNATDDPNRTFNVTLSSTADVIVPSQTTLITIVDDDGSALPLYAPTDMKYLGAFRLPTGDVGSATFEFGGNALAWNPENGSLFTGANVQLGLHIAEIAVPQVLGNSRIAADLPTAQVLQPFADLGNLLTVDAAGQNQTPALSYLNVNLGGLLVTEGGLTGAMFTGYNGAEPHESTHTHFRTKNLNLAAIDGQSFEGLRDLRRNGSNVVGRMLGGYMAAVPEQWQAWIGAKFVTGAAGLNRIQSSSSGPALFGFDANNPAGSLTEALVNYPFGKALQWFESAGGRSLALAQPLFNGTTKIEGVAFVPGTRSVIFLGSNGLSQIGYGVGSEFKDKSRTYQGYHSQNGVYRYQVWAYDIDDLVSVRNGSKAPWEVRPTLVHNFDLPTPEPSVYLGGTAFDPATGRLFVSQKQAGPGFTPVIHVYQLGR